MEYDSLNINRYGPCTVFIGPNGGGKTHLLTDLARRYNCAYYALSSNHISRMDYGYLRIGIVDGDNPYVITLESNATNLWGLLGRWQSAGDSRYAKTMNWMRLAFGPHFDIAINAEEVNYKDRVDQDWINIMHIPNGYLQLFIVLTALISNNKNLIIFDDPDTFLHPFASHIFCKAIEREVEEQKNIQVMIATHDPTLISHFEKQCWVVDRNALDQVTVVHVTDTEGYDETTEQYALGALYMACLYGAPPMWSADNAN